MAYSRLLLLLMGVISTQLPNARARSIDFWCKNDTRKSMMERIEDKTNCNASVTVQLPCVGIQATDWANKTLHQKRLEVMRDLHEFQRGVQEITTQATMGCQTSILKRLERSINNHWVIVNNLHIQNDNFTTSPPQVQSCSGQTTLNQVLKEYRRLLRGKLDHLAVDVQHSICRETRD